MSEIDRHVMGRVKHIHFVGVGGAGMSGIAEVLHNLGYEITGTDIKQNQATQHLENLGIRINTQHKKAHINGSDVVVVSSAVSDDNPELHAARKKRIPVVRRAEMLAELMRFRQGIAIAGTHGKTTTTSLIASILAEAGLDPTYVIGGLLNSGGSNAKLGTGPYLVAEADESDASFLHLQPVMTVLTNIDSDHLDTYGGDFENLKSNFLEFLHHIPFYGLAVMCCDDTGVQSILPKLNRPFVTYGVTEKADYRASNIRYANTKTRFTVSRIDQENWLEIELNMPGKHNVLNALAAISIAAELELSEDSIVKALSNFAGIGRRCDVFGEININNNQILLIDDYAHHPCEIAAITDAVRSGWPERRIVAIFQPHRYSRTRDLFDDFCQALSELDVLILLDVYPAGELPISSADSRALSRSIRSRGKLEPLFVEQRDELKTMLPNIVQDKDVLLILGAGDIGSLSKEIYEANGG